MADDHVGDEALELQPPTYRSNRDGISNGRIRLTEIFVRLGGARSWRICDNSDALDLSIRPLGDRHDPVTGPCEIPSEVDVLAGEILMDEKPVHERDPKPCAIRREKSGRYFDRVGIADAESWAIV